MSLSLALAGALLFGQTQHSVTVDVDFGQDVGQNYGTLFEATDASGTTIAGAGFLGVYNTESRSDRRKLHIYLKPTESTAALSLERLPEPSTDAGVYLFDFAGRIFARSRAEGKDTQLRSWDDSQQQWAVDATAPLFPIAVADGVLAVKPQTVTFNNQSILELKTTDGRIGENYYGNGWFIFRRLNLEASPPHSELVAARWSPNNSQPVDLEQSVELKMRTPGEFVYAFGQLDPHIFATTNTGGVYSFDGTMWSVWREPSPGVSFQIYSIINFEDRLLMGQYPTGQLFEFDGQHFRHLENQPPVMPGVSPNAREAQTLAIYGGELYAGVWPWGEVWKFNRQRRDWQLAGRVFPHPELTKAETHPYENETKKLDPVLNRWGQRVTGLVPHGDSLYISTSAKSSNPFESKFTFLDGDKWRDYGAVYRHKQPGNLAVQVEWKNRPTRFEFVSTADRLTLLQDGKELGAIPLDSKLTANLAGAKFTFGNGVYGNFRGKVVAWNVGGAKD